MAAHDYMARQSDTNLLWFENEDGGVGVSAQYDGRGRTATVDCVSISCLGICWIFVKNELDKCCERLSDIG